MQHHQTLVTKEVVHKKLSLKAGLRIGSRLANVGAAAGIISGWLSLMLKEDATDIASLSGSIYLILGLAFPVAFSAVLYSAKQKGVMIEGQVPEKIGLLLVIGLLTWALGTVFYVIAAYIIPGTFGEVDMNSLVRAIRETILWEKSLIVGTFSLIGILSLGLLYR